MEETQALRQQLEEARDEAELNLLQLQQVQEDLEAYLLRCGELEAQLAAQGSSVPPAAPAGDGESHGDRARLAQLEVALQERERQLAELERLRQEDQQLLRTAQTMLDGQARYLEDVSLREEKAAQSLDRLRLLEAELLHYLGHSRPLPSLDPERIPRLRLLARSLVEPGR